MSEVTRDEVMERVIKITEEHGDDAPYKTVEALLKAEKRIADLMTEDHMWEEHMRAEEPGELYWNEIIGISNMEDSYRICQLENDFEAIYHLISELERFHPGASMVGADMYRDEYGGSWIYRKDVLKILERFIKNET